MSNRSPLANEVRVASEIAAQIIAAGIDPETDPDFAAILGAETDVLDRLRAILRAARYAEAQSKALAEIQAEMRERKARLERKSDSLRGIVMHAMGELGLKKLEAADLTATVSAGKPSVVITDADALPDDVCVMKREPSKAAIREALAEGPVPGAELGNPVPSLTVRVR